METRKRTILTLKGVIINAIYIYFSMFPHCQLFSKEYGKHYLPAIVIEEDTFGCVFSPSPHPKPINDEEWRWDTCYWGNLEIKHTLSQTNFKDFYVLNDGYLMFSSIFAVYKRNCIGCSEYDCDLTECLNLNPEINYTGYAACSLSGKEVGDYKLFFFENSRLIKEWVLNWEGFLDFVKWDKEQGGTMEYRLKINYWYSWGN